MKITLNKLAHLLESLVNEEFNIDTSKLYFHGTYDENLTSLDKPSIDRPFCVTQDIGYAMEYAKLEYEDDIPDGFVYVVTIDDDSLRIFDFRDSSDVRKLIGLWPEEIVEMLQPNSGQAADPLMTFDKLAFHIENETNPELNLILDEMLLPRLNELYGTHSSDMKEFFRTQSISEEYVLRRLLFSDLLNLGYNGFVAYERRRRDSNNCYILFDVKCIDKIYFKPLTYAEAKKALRYLQRMPRATRETSGDEQLRSFINALDKTNN